MDRERVYLGRLLLINAEHPLRGQGEPASLARAGSLPGIRSLEPRIALEETCLHALAALLAEAEAEEDILVVSGYRSMEEQTLLYEQSLRDNGPVYTASYVALPGRSEHQSGLAVDVGERRYDDVLDLIAPSFPDEGRCLAFKRLAAKHGFIQRYKEGKEQWTSIACEPWHFRYVGAPHAEWMERLGFCLEEYIGFLKRYSYEGEWLAKDGDGEKSAIYFVQAEESGPTVVPIPVCDRYELSGNNADGFVVTAFWKERQPDRNG
nr:D-alanyl-D-alanine carboxypeptidase family protein [Paenibacillus soyae]